MKSLAKTLAKSATLTFAAVGLAGAAITPAYAAETEKMSIDVQTSDLDLATPQGQKALDRRIEKAARTVCRTNDITTGSRVLTQEARACLAKARSDVRQQVAALTASQQRGG